MEIEALEADLGGTVQPSQPFSLVPVSSVSHGLLINSTYARWLSKNVNDKSIKYIIARLASLHDSVAPQCVYATIECVVRDIEYENISMTLAQAITTQLHSFSSYVYATPQTLAMSEMHKSYVVNMLATYSDTFLSLYYRVLDDARMRADLQELFTTPLD